MRISTGNERGSVVLMYTLASTVLFGMVGLTVDIGWMYFREQAARAAAESAAMAAISAAMANSSGGIACGSNGIACQSATACPANIGTPVNNLQNGCLYAKENGFQVGAARQNVLMAANTTAVPTVSGVNTQYWVSATVVEQIPQGFSAVLGDLLGTVSTRATAALSGSAFGDCIYVLDPLLPLALTVTGSAQVTSGCGVWVNSSDPAALQVLGNGCLTVQSDGIHVVGNDIGSKTCLSPAPTTGIGSFTDPLASIPAPSWSATGCKSAVNLSGGSQTLDPGVYCGGITASGGTLTLNPGVYVLDGGGFNISGANTTITGSGVTIYNSGDLTHLFSPVSISGQATITLSAPTSGTYGNVLFFEDRSKGGALVQNTFSGGSNIQITGVLYFRNSGLTYSGGSSTNDRSVGIVADRVTFTGNTYIQNGISGNGGTGAKVALIE